MNAINVLMNRVAFEHLGAGPADRVLEIGFGPGSLLDQLLARSSCLAGLDLSPTMVKEARRRLGSRVRACCGSALALPFIDRTFTKICTVNTVYFWEDPRQAFTECRRVLSPDGALVVCFNAHHELAREAWDEFGFILHTEDDVASSLRAAGFACIDRRVEVDPEQGEFFCLRAWEVASPGGADGRPGRVVSSPREVVSSPGELDSSPDEVDSWPDRASDWPREADGWLGEANAWPGGADRRPDQAN
jgi:SAM-dependent methyltransferase